VERNENWERVVGLKDTERCRLFKLCSEELPTISQAMNVNASNIEQAFEKRVRNNQELTDARS
jgi:hypothetical protein